MVPLKVVGLLLLYFSITTLTLAQDRDSTYSEVETQEYSDLPKNPKKATILSAILPGAGQVYNEKAWKVPIIYGGFITDIYFISYNNRYYQSFKVALKAFDKEEPNDFPNLNRQSLERNVNYWRKNRDLCYLLIVGIYALNLVDANVDAHLSGFDVSDDISMKIEPHYESFSANNNSMGFSIKLNF
jgi:hypothetical protein